MIVILGPTAAGKTSVAVQTAYRVDGEIISADSRQVFRGMDIGTGKDLSEYRINDRQVPYHLIDIVEAGEEYSVFNFQRDFLKAWNDIRKRGKIPILCGGTGFYIESVLKQYQLAPVPDNMELWTQLETHTAGELTELLSSMRKLHNTTDITDRKRLIRAIEIETYYREYPEKRTHFPKIEYQVFGVSFMREIVRKRITERLLQRLKNGMVEEVEALLRKGVSAEQLEFYGLEYRYITQFINREVSYETMFCLLNTAIHQFAKRQMTWFRKMEREGIPIQWVDENLDTEEKANFIVDIFCKSRQDVRIK